MLAKLRGYRTHAVAMLVAAGLGSAATAFGLFDEQLTIVAPVEIVGGNPIIGYVLGLEDNCSLDASYGGPGSGTLTPPPPPPSSDPSGTSSTSDPTSGDGGTSGSTLLTTYVPFTPFPNQRVTGNTNPLDFMFQTIEEMAPGVMCFTARDSDETASASTRIK